MFLLTTGDDPALPNSMCEQSIDEGNSSWSHAHSVPNGNAVFPNKQLMDDSSSSGWSSWSTSSGSSRDVCASMSLDAGKSIDQFRAPTSNDNNENTVIAKQLMDDSSTSSGWSGWSTSSINSLNASIAEDEEEPTDHRTQTANENPNPVVAEWEFDESTTNSDIGVSITEDEEELIDHFRAPSPNESLDFAEQMIDDTISTSSSGLYTPTAEESIDQIPTPTLISTTRTLSRKPPDSSLQTFTSKHLLSQHKMEHGVVRIKQMERHSESHVEYERAPEVLRRLRVRVPRRQCPDTLTAAAGKQTGFTCPLCQIYFNTKELRRKHIFSSHPEDYEFLIGRKRILCPERSCNRFFSGQNGLRAHQVRAHPVKYDELFMCQRVVNPPSQQQPPSSSRQSGTCQRRSKRQMQASNSHTENEVSSVDSQAGMGTCPVCRITFSRSRDVRRHLAVYHSEDVLVLKRLEKSLKEKCPNLWKTIYDSRDFADSHAACPPWNYCITITTSQVCVWEIRSMSKSQSSPIDETSFRGSIAEYWDKLRSQIRSEESRTNLLSVLLLSNPN